MKIPQHSYKNFDTPRCPNGKPIPRPPKKLNGWLGTGVLDVDGHEIFEGDRIKFVGESVIQTVVFIDGCFCLDTIKYPFHFYRDSKLKIVGHVKED